MARQKIELVCRLQNSVTRLGADDILACRLGDLVMARQKIELAAEQTEELSRRARATTVSVRDRRRAEIIVLSAQGLSARHCQQALPGQRVPQHLVRQAEAAAPIVEGDAFFANQPAGARNVMVAQVLADAGQRVAHLDAEIAQAFGLADAG